MTDRLMADALKDLADRDEGEKCLAIHGLAVLESLGFNDEDIHEVGGVDKLRGRPCGKVREFAEYAKSKKPEERQYLLTRFAKNVEVVS